MSAVTAIHEQHALAKRRIAAARDEAAARLRAHEHAAALKASQLAQIEAAYVESATSEALGLEPTRDLPDANVLERLRAEVAVAEPVQRQLAANVRACEGELAAAETKHKAAVADYLREAALKPALMQLEQAFDGLRDAAVNVMAAHTLANHDFSERRQLYNSANDIPGPAAQWLAILQGMDWPDYPYAIRPDWLPAHGRFWPDEMPGVAERKAELLAQVVQVPA